MELPTKEALEKAIVRFEEGISINHLTGVTGASAKILEEIYDELKGEHSEEHPIEMVPANVTLYFDMDKRSETYYNVDYPLKELLLNINEHGANKEERIRNEHDTNPGHDVQG